MQCSEKLQKTHTKKPNKKTVQGTIQVSGSINKCRVNVKDYGSTFEEKK